MVDEHGIRYVGAPAMTETGVEVMAIHLHRFLIGWLEHMRFSRLWVTLGFEGTLCESATFAVEKNASCLVDVGWTFEDLCHTYRRGDSRLHLELAGEDGPLVLQAVPILDRPALGGEASVTLGFVLLPEALALDESALSSLQAHVYEAICAARRNSMRLFFDDHRATDVKSLLYAFMDHLPEWIGCDYCATMILASSLETMTLEDAPTARFNVLAERAYLSDSLEDFERLVGMTVSTEDDPHNVLAAAFARQREDAELPYQLFSREQSAGASAWKSVDRETTHSAFHRARARSREEMMALVPLVAGEGKDQELLGFLGLTWRESTSLPSSAGQLLAEGSEQLAMALRHSTLYTLSARKLWILRKMRRVAETILASFDHPGDSHRTPPSEEALSSLIEQVSQMIAAHVEVPSFAIASLEVDQGDGEGEAPTRHVRYRHPHGWAHYDQLRLPVDLPEKARTDSSVASLAVRLNKPLVLAGGYGAGEELNFKNSLFVHEESGAVRDVRAGGLDASSGWVALSDYYMPARDRAYATLAYPISFDREPLGVLAVEVDKSTDWLWWTGFGGHLFWQLVASELASAFYQLGVRGAKS
ncbi:unnamed protein product [Laminaria digitata]